MSTITYKAPLKSSLERALCGDEVLACAKIKPIDNVGSRKDELDRRAAKYTFLYIQVRRAK
jgi:hypothetical protein